MTDPLPTWESTTFMEGLRFGECPRWHEGRLWYSDFFTESVCSVDPTDPKDPRVECEVDGGPAGLGWLPNGDLLVVARKQRVVLRFDGNALSHHGDLAPWATFHGNDMVVAGDGHAYVGNFGFDLDAFLEEKGVRGLLLPPGPPTTSMIHLDPDGRSSEAAADLSFPNGTVLTPDGGTLIVAETLAGRLTAFDRLADGSLANRRVWAAVPGIAPDGICLDADGCVWVANAIGHECVRVAQGGAILARVTTSQNAYACMLAGEDRRTLYVVTAPASAEAAVAHLTDGRIEQARVDVGGAGLP